MSFFHEMVCESSYLGCKHVVYVSCTTGNKDCFSPWTTFKKRSQISLNFEYCHDVRETTWLLIVDFERKKKFEWKGKSERK